MKTAPWLRFHRNRREGWYEFQFMAEPFMDGIIKKHWSSEFRRIHKKGPHCWAVWLHGLPAPIFMGSFAECKRFVRLMWESMRQYH